MVEVEFSSPLLILCMQFDFKVEGEHTICSRERRNISYARERGREVNTLSTIERCENDEVDLVPNPGLRYRIRGDELT